MRVTLLLADYAVVADGKLFVSGGGWSVTTPGAPSAIAMKLDVPWDRANSQLHLRLRLIGQDGEPVVFPGPEGPQPVEINGDVEVGRPPGVLPGADLDFPLVFQIGPLPLQPGQRYEWVLDIDGVTEADWHLTFSTRAAPPGQATYIVEP